MIVTHLALANVRNYVDLDWSPAPGLNLLVGENAQGKSNLLEAIAMLGTGKSFRTSREGELLREGMPVATIGGQAQLLPGNVRLACRLALGANGLRKTYTRNGKPVRYAGYLGTLRVVVFVPAHLALVSGPPALRRTLINTALSQEGAGYYAALARYASFVTQKGALLRAAPPLDLDLLATYDEHLSAAGTQLMLARRAFVAALDERARQVHRSWLDDAEGALELRYVPNVEFETPTEDAVQAAYRARLEQMRAAEIARKLVLVGPHRDDLEFRLAGRPLAAFGSQGQQRTAVLALKAAEYGELEARGGEAPVMLLDDVLSELDPVRRRAFLHGLGAYRQVFVTATTDVEDVRGAVFRVRAATLERVA